MAPPVTPPISLFPSAPTLAFAIDPALQAAVAAALAELATARSSTVPFSFALIDLDGGGSTGTLKCGAHRPDEEHYIASAAKVAALYAAYALRDMARRYTATASVAAAVAAATKAAASTPNLPGFGLLATVAVLQSVTGPPPKLPPLFEMLRKSVDPAIDAGSGPVLAAAVQRAHRVPQYEQVFAPPGAALPDFRGPFLTAMRDMIVPSDNAGAGRCVRGVGYGYLNGAMAAAGLFDAKAQSGVWLAGDFVGTYPYARIASANDGQVAQAGSALALAKLLALIVNRGVLDTTSCDAMRTLLAGASKGIDTPWLARSDIGAALRIPLAQITHAKLGFGPLKKGGNVCSEMFRVEGLGKPAKSYAVAFQNLNPQVMALDDVAFMLRRSIQIYEK